MTCRIINSLMIVIFLIFSGKSYSQENDNALIQQKIHEYIAPYLQLNLFSGVILVAQNNNVIFQQAYGNAVAEFNIGNSIDTKFRIASLSKPFTKLAVLKLAETGALKLSDKLIKFIPDYPNGDRITINQLINHSSGINHLNDFPNYDKLAKEKYSIEEIISLFKDKSLDYPPGTDTTYSNSGYVLLSYIIERVSGMPYGDYLKENIFKPAGMINTGHEKSKVIVQNLAHGYMQNLSGDGLQKAPHYDISIKIGGGSIYSTVNDLLEFKKAYKEGQLSKSTEPLYNEGVFGRSPGYTSVMWHNDEYFVTALSNNYSTPIERLGFDIVKLTLGMEYSTIEIPNGQTNKKLVEYQGEYEIGKDKVTIQAQDNFLVAFENDDFERGWRLFPNGDDVFFDSRFLEDVTFDKNSEGEIIYFFWGEDVSEIVRKKIKRSSPK